MATRIIGDGVRVEEPTADRPFGTLGDFISEEELRAPSDRYKRIAGYSIADFATGPAAAAGLHLLGESTKL